MRLLRAAENAVAQRRRKFFKIKIKRSNPYRHDKPSDIDLTHIDMTSHLISNTSRFYRPKLHQSVVLQALRVRIQWRRIVQGPMQTCIFKWDTRLHWAKCSASPLGLPPQSQYFVFSFPFAD